MIIIVCGVCGLVYPQTADCSILTLTLYSVYWPLSLVNRQCSNKTGVFIISCQRREVEGNENQRKRVKDIGGKRDTHRDSGR